jgi:hypothetical protein
MVPPLSPLSEAVDLDKRTREVTMDLSKEAMDDNTMYLLSREFSGIGTTDEVSPSLSLNLEIISTQPCAPSSLLVGGYKQAWSTVFGNIHLDMR